MSTSKGHSLWRFRAPRYWPLLLTIGLLRLCVMLPYRLQYVLGQGLGRLMCLALPKRRHVAEVNLRLCFPELDERARKRLLGRHFGSLGVGIFDFAMAIWASDRRIARLTKFDGIDNIQQHLQAGRGVILLSGHFAGIEFTGRALALTIPDMAAVYRANRNPLINELMRRGRIRGARHLITKKDIRQMMRLLKAGGIPVWYASDQSYRGKGAILLPFFGEPAMTNPALTQIARIGEAAVVPYLPLRLPGGRGFHVSILPALEAFPTDDAAADSVRVNELLEEQIRKAPEQYYWVHRRFKGRPEEYPDPYRS